MRQDSLGDRMKMYEKASSGELTRRVPVIMRLDGRAFHTFTKKYCQRPFDDWFRSAMVHTAQMLVSEIQGAKCAYIQSDEITILITDFDRLTSEPWFGYKIQKMCSVGAAIATVAFNNAMIMQNGESNPSIVFRSDTRFLNAQFDARVFNIPKEDVANNFVWRQKDWLRNSIQMYCRSFFSQKEMMNKNVNDMHEMLYEIGKNWASDLDAGWKNGVFLSKQGNGDDTMRSIWATSNPIFTENRNIFEKLMTPEEQ